MKSLATRKLIVHERIGREFFKLVNLGFMDMLERMNIQGLFDVGLMVYPTIVKLLYINLNEFR